jgi:hypothetical protein
MAFNPTTFLVGTIWAHGYRLVKITRRSHSTVPEMCPEPDLPNVNFNSIIRDSAGDNPKDHLNLIFPVYLKLMTGFPSVYPEDVRAEKLDSRV